MTVAPPLGGLMAHTKPVLDSDAVSRRVIVGAAVAPAVFCHPQLMQSALALPSLAWIIVKAPSRMEGTDCTASVEPPHRTMLLSRKVVIVGIASVVAVPVVVENPQRLT